MRRQALSPCRHRLQQGPGALALQPGQVRALAQQQISRKPQTIDAEPGHVFPLPPHREEPVVTEDQVVGMEGPDVAGGVAETELQGMGLVGGRQVLGALPGRRG